MAPANNQYLPVDRSVAVVGGITTLQPQYRKILEQNNFNPKICNHDAKELWGKVGGAAFIILFAATVSHGMAISARKAAASHGIPLVTVTPSSVSALRRCLSTLSL